MNLGSDPWTDLSVKEFIEYDGDIFMNISDLTIDTMTAFKDHLMRDIININIID